MNILTLDYETFWQKGYTLRTSTVEEYVRDPKFEVIMVSLKMNDNPTFWVPAPDIPRVFKLIPWNTTAVLSQQAQFDMAILGWHYGIYPRFYLDTIPMFAAIYPEEPRNLENIARVLWLPPKGHEVQKTASKHFVDFTKQELNSFGNYAIRDADITWAAFNILKPYFPLSELKLIDIVTRMFVKPVFHLDPKLLKEAYDDEIKRKQELMEKAGADRKALGSNPVLASLLLDAGVDPPKKISAAWSKKHPDDDPGEEPVGLITEKGAWTYAFAKTDEAFKRISEGENAAAACLAEARLGVKSSITETRLARMINVQKRGTLPVYLKVWAAHTGRLGGADLINLQNLSRECGADGCEQGKVKVGE